mmetsp:Transcript_5557/g.12327  ORF Transcript_5557/g.12327 Transcript_5557/m.12327 type:complete len:104 (-) Transcript_5557:307-618(-)
MISVFVSIVRLNAQNEKYLLGWDAEGNSTLESLGSTVLFETVAYLRDTGLLREVAGRPISRGHSVMDGIDLGSTMYCCDLSREEAMRIAKSIDFSLGHFLDHP